MWQLLEKALASSDNGFSMGSFGAIGEFMRGDDEPYQLLAGDRLGCITTRGGLVIDPLPSVRPIAYEYISRDPRYWVHGIAFCVPETEATMNNYAVVTELGKDHSAFNEADRQHILFDVGLQQGFVDVAVRTDDPELIKILRQACGTNLLAPDNPAMQAIIQADPHRVFTTKLGRLEVYQPIGKEKTPQGPHSHVLPKLMASGRNYPTIIPIPKGFLPVFTLHLANPCKDLMGNKKVFDAHQHHEFQHYISRFANEEYRAMKQATFAALDGNVDCEKFAVGKTRLERRAMRVAIRQYHKLYSEKADLVNRWRHRFDHPVNDDALINKDSHQ